MVVDFVVAVLAAVRHPGDVAPERAVPEDVDVAAGIGRVDVVGHVLIAKTALEIVATCRGQRVRVVQIHVAALGRVEFLTCSRGVLKVLTPPAEVWRDRERQSDGRGLIGVAGRRPDYRCRYSVVKIAALHGERILRAQQNVHLAGGADLIRLPADRPHAGIGAEVLTKELGPAPSKGNKVPVVDGRRIQNRAVRVDTAGRHAHLAECLHHVCRASIGRRRCRSRTRSCWSVG